VCLLAVLDCMHCQVGSACMMISTARYSTHLSQSTLRVHLSGSLLRLPCPLCTVSFTCSHPCLLNVTHSSLPWPLVGTFPHSP
jgi:hypothetical protein